ncbi:uncharacterized protein LOC113289203 [Papaver somniferum]|nr:uncharacterized protein LOC113289203 [Papaver somniferum]
MSVMDLSNQKITTPRISPNKILMELNCSNPFCFFCVMKETNPSLRTSGISKCFKEIPHKHDQEHVLVLSTLWNIAMTHPNDPEFPSSGVFECMASLIRKGLHNRDWLLRDQNIYIPYYAAHIIGSYTMNKIEFAEKAVKSGVISPLMELMRGKMSWVEQRVAVRALGHLASYKTTFDSVAEYEKEIIELAMEIASTCLDVVYVKFVAVKDKKKRLRYHCDLLTRGVGGSEMENVKAEEWASQLQCWSIYLINCFACKERSLNLICKPGFLKDLSMMWGGLVNHTSPCGIGLIRILCYSKRGRKSISESKHVLQSLCNLARSSDDWQYMGIDCLLLLLKDQDTRFKVMEISVLVLADLVEMKTLGGIRKRVGESITETLLLDFDETKNVGCSNVVENALSEVWHWRVERRQREMGFSEEEIEERRVVVGAMKQQGNESFRSGNIEEAIMKFTEGINLCPLKMRKERMILYSNRSQCYLLLREPDLAISDSTRALSLSYPTNSHNKSLWRRSQAYDMKGLAKESLMDCIMFVNGLISSDYKENAKVPYYASRMINRQMSVTWLFAASERKLIQGVEKYELDGYQDDSDYDDCNHDDDDIMRMTKVSMPGLSPIEEDDEGELLMTRRKKKTSPWRR